MTINPRQLQLDIQAWFDQNKRELPWRFTSNPYHIWISEIMLQQTKASVVIPYYTRFLRLFPGIEDLAAAQEEEVFKVWEGLGYYSRARNLQKGARYICNNYAGRFPKTYAEILSIPGIGPYTAGAISSFAFQKNEAAVDGNVIRVFARLLAHPWDRTKQKHRDELAKWMKENIFSASCISPATWNEACIELGALICLPKSPKCTGCPWKKVCRAYHRNEVSAFPVRQEKRTLPEDSFTVFILQNKQDDTFLIHRRPSTGLLAGLWEFPMLDGEYSSEMLQDFWEEVKIKPVAEDHFGRKKHIFSHKIWLLDFHRFLLKKEDLLKIAMVLSAQEEETPTLFTLYAQEQFTASETVDQLHGSWQMSTRARLRTLAFSAAFREVLDIL